jgi:hypothetical protein
MVLRMMFKFVQLIPLEVEQPQQQHKEHQQLHRHLQSLVLQQQPHSQLRMEPLRLLNHSPFPVRRLLLI